MTFKPYTQGQMMVPTSVEELIPQGHLARVMSEVIDALDSEPLQRRHKGGGTSGYHPLMVLRVLVYAYTQRVHSSARQAGYRGRKRVRAAQTQLRLSTVHAPGARKGQHRVGPALYGPQHGKTGGL